MRPNTPESFWARVDRSGGPNACHPWRGRTLRGYGQLRWKGVNSRAHRLAWELANGRSVPAGLVVRHACDNRGCCNPGHLIPGTVAENNRDMVERKRHAAFVEPGFSARMAKARKLLVQTPEAIKRWQAAGIRAAASQTREQRVERCRRGAETLRRKGPRAHALNANRAVGERNGTARLSTADVAAIRVSSEPSRRVALAYGVAPSTIQRIRSGLMWKHVVREEGKYRAAEQAAQASAERSVEGGR